ncbi:uncharacterized protein LOC143032905 isoform X2 [Oratosquilla oratoria]|uniref:uncharacterized protein LOC143032905 isoform X2 n=1 Tax=Oratosquilla oratoria TaxID=337810 RepID=UPI003F76D650
MADTSKYVRLKRSETCGFGFSILGGAGSELPPIIYDIIEGSPAANSSQLAPGDIICEVNGQEVITFTTKEADAGIQERVRQYLATPPNMAALRSAITHDDLQGVKQIVAKKQGGKSPTKSPAKSTASSPAKSATSSPAKTPVSPARSDRSEPLSERSDCDSSRVSDGVEDSTSFDDRTAHENERNKQKKQKSEAYLMTGDLILNLSRTSHDPSWLPQQKPVDDLRKSGSTSMPTSPNETDISGARGARHDVVGSPQSLCSPVSIDSNVSATQFTYPHTSTQVRISKSEDHLQYQNDNMCAVNIDLEEDVTSSLNTLLDTRDDDSGSPPNERDRRIVWTFNAPQPPLSPESVRSSHDSDSPLLRSPSSPHSPLSPKSPTSSMQYSMSGIYDKMRSGRDSLGSSNRSDNIISHSSGLTSPDTDIPDELEWDDMTPTSPITPTNANGFCAKDSIPNGHGVRAVMSGSATNDLVHENTKVRKRPDENRIVIKVEGPDRESSSGRRRKRSSGREDDCLHEGDVTPTNTQPPSPSSGTLSPDTLAYQELRESEDELTCVSEEEVRGATIKTANSTTAATSPPLSEDESDIESLHSFHYSPKAVDLPSAIRLAKRLYNLEGFKKSDVSRHLSKNNEFSRVVAEEYLHYFDFTGDTLDIALRKFLDKFCLAGETQERERVLVHFSRRFLECNPGTFNSQDAVHTLTCALMLLNTDLHGQNVGRKMTCGEFIENLSELNDGENFPREVLKSLYQAMRTQPLHWATDDDSENAKGAPGKSSSDSSSHVVGSNPFLEPPAGSGVDYKKGYIMRKCCTDPNGKRTAFGKRSWKMFYCVVQDLVLYLHKDEQGARRGPQYQLGHNAIRLHHALATRATDYNKKEHVFRLETADQAEYLLQTSDSKELQAWIDTINYVAASLSAPPLPGAVGSQKKFQRPLLPCSITKLNLREQMEDHIKRLAQLEADLEDHKAHPPEKNAKSATISNYKEKEAHLICEVKRYHTYVYLLRSKVSLQPSLDSGELPVFEAPPGLADSDEHMEDRGGQRIIPPPIPERSRPSESPDPPPKSPLAVRKQLEIAQDEDEGNDINTVSGNGKYCETLNPFFDGDDELEPESEASENKEKENKLKVKEEKERKKLEKKERKEEEKRVKTLERKEKKDREKEKKEKEREKKEKERQEQEEKATKEKEKQKSNSQEDDPQLGTLNRLSAIFKFNKLNSRKEDEEILNDKLELQKDDDDEAPPLPPKPSPNSPIMKNIGTRIDI